uniref:Period circadian protein n=1 Tax=Photinus pyralis TaxID=7054 RepID=A0A1Y1LDT3_PHOPY
MYNPVFPSPVFCTPMAMVPFSLPQPVAPFIPDSKTVLKSTLSGRQRSTSRATSVKAEPGSAIGSNVSASCVNRTVETVEDKFVDSAPYDEGSSHSSSYSSFFKTDNGFSSNEDSAGENGRKDKNNRAHAVRKCDPVWMQAVNVTPDLIYRYQMSTMDLDEVLKADHNAMENVKQPDFVNEQLHELYLSMEDEQKSPTYNLYGSVSSSEQEYNNYSDTVIHERMANSILMMIYEENAALPSSDH